MNTLTSGLDDVIARDSDLVKRMINWGMRQLNHQTRLKKLLIQQVAA